MNSPLILTIDTTQSKKTSVSLIYGEITKLKEVDTPYASSQMTLPMIDALLRESGFSLEDVTEIQVNEGPGSFTGVRVGLSIAYTLHVLCGIPINGQDLLVKAKYNQVEYIHR